MRSLYMAIGAILFPLLALSQNSIEGNFDTNEIRYYQGKPYDKIAQQQLRATDAWQTFLDAHGTWYVHFNEINGMPHRGYGEPLNVAGATLQEKALLFAEQDLQAFNLPLNNLVSTGKEVTSKYSYQNFRQYHENLLVVGSRYVVKFFEDKVIMFGCDVFPNINVSTTPSITPEQAAVFASTGIGNEVLTTMISSGMKILPVPNGHEYQFHLIYEVMVRTIDAYGVPANYQTYVDAHTGLVLSRTNTVNHIAPGGPGNPKGQPQSKGKASENMLQVTATVTGQVYENNPTETPITQDLENIYVTVSNVNYAADGDGNVTVPVNPGSAATVKLMGPWCRIYTGNTTPTLNVTLQDGQNDISMDNVSNIRERSAYRSVQTIHDFQKLWMPADFTAMDFQLTTNIDVAGTCNAFYDGQSINFYNIGGGCNATSLIADVCHHEYGHGINDNFYQSLGGFWINGAMGEGYADFWALAANDTPLLGIGFNTGDNEPLRRYDIDPKVYPSDISGEVHSDGEIIMGAWWDTHLLMGADWNITLPLFVEAYHGLQAELANGNEGEAYTDVLLDALQADDDDGDLSNGTPHGDQIVDGFYIHGITLISNASIVFNPIPFHTTETNLDLEVALELQFPFTQYLDDVQCFYKIDNQTWNETDMVSDNDGNYLYVLPGQPAGTVVAHYFGAHDINGSISGVVPIGAHLDPFPNLPFFTLVGVVEIASHDCDDNANFGQWQTGIVGDNATTGDWEEDAPVGSVTTDAAAGTIVQPFEQHTPGGEFCFITANAANTSAGIGDSDVDDGKTTLQSPIMDMTDLLDPIIAYYRWYTNSPPGGANPGQDYWQVRISNDAGANWVYVENNKTSDLSWRRNAFHVSDYVTPTSQMRFQFIASDSLQVGQNLDGGSLVEAAMDDFILYDALIIGVEENEMDNNIFSVYPNPAVDRFSVVLGKIQTQNITVEVVNTIGEIVYSKNVVGVFADQQIEIDLPNLANGKYSVVLKGEDFSSTQQLVIRK